MSEAMYKCTTKGLNGLQRKIIIKCKCSPRVLKTMNGMYGRVNMDAVQNIMQDPSN